MGHQREAWDAGGAYEAYVGRWSRRVAVAFVRSLGVPVGGRWLDAGCGTGALTAAVLAIADPARVVGVDTSAPFVAHAGARIADRRAGFAVGDMRGLPLPDAGLAARPAAGTGAGSGGRAGGGFDAVVSGLALNFVPEPERAVAEFARVAAPGGVVAAYVWDYAEGMGMLRAFWDAAAVVDPAASALDEGRRFPLCRPEPLARLWSAAGLDEVGVRPIEVPTVFAGFDDYWQPFLGGQGPAPGYLLSLPEERRLALRDLLRAGCPPTPPVRSASSPGSGRYAAGGRDAERPFQKELPPDEVRARGKAVVVQEKWASRPVMRSSRFMPGGTPAIRSRVRWRSARFWAATRMPSPAASMNDSLLTSMTSVALWRWPASCRSSSRWVRSSSVVAMSSSPDTATVRVSLWRLVVR
nr:class I SAM-dependent methyltransferase [Nonomuraea zeae]